MQALLDRLNGPLHLAVALACAWLVFGSPWIGMYHQMPDEPGWTNVAHVALGFAVLAAGALYFAACVQGGRWRLYFPWTAEGVGAVLRDLGGLARGRRPTADGAGLLTLIEGLLLLALLGAAASGAAWFFTQGGDAAVAWREHHIVAARAFALLMLLHVVGVALHVVDLVRD